MSVRNQQESKNGFHIEVTRPRFKEFLLENLKHFWIPMLQRVFESTSIGFNACLAFKSTFISKEEQSNDACYHCTTSLCTETCSIALARAHTRAKLLSRAKIARAKLLSTVQSHIPNRNFVVAAATQVTVTLCFHKSVLTCFTLNETFGMLQLLDRT